MIRRKKNIYNCYPVHINDEFYDVEILMDGNEIGVEEEYLDLADLILKDIDRYIDEAVRYIGLYFNDHNTKDYCLDIITFGKVISIKGLVSKGFTINFTYSHNGDIYNMINLKVKFTKDGHIIGIECGLVF